MNVIPLDEVSSGQVALVGGKAAGLGELVRAGERVPAGFCLTTESYRSKQVPTDELERAYQRLGGGPVAVRSSATAEDLPEASFAGQQDTILDVTGTEELERAVRRCWDSLHTERAVAYRAAIDVGEAEMAVVVQRMVDPTAAGVLFTANPITGRRAEMVVDAVPGLGTAVVDGSAVPDHYVLDGQPAEEAAEVAEGCLNVEQLTELWAAGQRVQDHFGSPQDIEWAYDGDGVLWLLQSRPITTLFPLPPDRGRPQPRVYMEAGTLQGMHRPMTPMGNSVRGMVTAAYAEGFGMDADPDDGQPGTVVIAGRMFLDLTSMVRSSWFRTRLPERLEIYGPRVQAAIERVLRDPRFAPDRRLPLQPRWRPAVRSTRRLTFEMAGMLGILARPKPARERAFRLTEQYGRRHSDPVPAEPAAELLGRVRRSNDEALYGEFGPVMRTLMTGLLVMAPPHSLLDGVATEAELDTVLGGLPHNVTTEMDLELWRLAAGAAEHRELLLGTEPAELARRYHAGTLPDIGLDAFLQRYGHRAAAEIDVGVPRWDEDPAPLFATVANYLRVDDPEQAPDRRFARASARAEAMLKRLSARGRARRPVRGRLAAFFLRRQRELTGLRELGKFVWLYQIRHVRRLLLRAGEDLVGRGLLERADDIMFLDFRQALAAAEDGVDQRAVAAEQRAEYERETRRRSVPVVMLSDGTLPEALADPATGEDGALTGMPGSPGVATGRARVVHDPSGAHIEPGEILVAPATDPGWTPLFLTAGGLVTETGSPVGHGPTVAREYGIPCVICVRDVTRVIATGDLVTVDGAAGTVRFAEVEKVAEAEEKAAAENG